MRNVFPSIVKKITNISVAASLGAMTLLGGAARAETVQQRAQAELNNGADYVAAWQSASRATRPDSATQVDRIAVALNAGQDYLAAWDAARNGTDSVSSDEQIARARRVEAALNAGQDYVAAWTAPDEQPARVETAEPVVETARGSDLTLTVK